jgi:hypothetical protein
MMPAVRSRSCSRREFVCWLPADEAAARRLIDAADESAGLEKQ